jgi:transposase-like protein
VENAKPFPKSLLEAIRYFQDPAVCVEFMAQIRWPNGIECPHCQSKRHSFLRSRRIWKCLDCRKQFSAKVGTIFEDSAIPLDKWLAAVWLLVNNKNGISSWELHRGLKVTQKAAWFMLQRIRHALKLPSAQTPDDQIGGFGAVEVDETFIGGRVKNMHADRKLKLRQLRNEVNRPDHYMGKTVVMGMLDRGLRQVRAKVVPNTKRETLQAHILKEVFPGSKVYTDEHTGYMGLEKKFAHDVVNHLESYVEGKVHTNGIENFWSLLKRGLNGTYVAVEPFHLFRYVDEQVFRYNNRATKDNPLNDADRFLAAMHLVTGKRLTYAEVTGKNEARPF